MKKCVGMRSLWIVAVCLMMLMSYGCSGGGGGGSDDGNNNIQPFTVEYAALNYRNHEDPADNYVGGYVGLANNGSIIDATDVVDDWMTDSAGFDVFSDNDGFGVDRFYWYECRGGPCTQSALVVDSSIWAYFFTLPADTYTGYLQMSNGQLLTVQVNYPGEIHLPLIMSATMQSQWIAGDLVLSWTNPTLAPNWSLVTRIRIVIKTTTGPAVIQVNLDPSAETVTIPASLVADAEALGLGALLEWRVEARLYDTQDRNTARSVSNLIPLAPVP